MNPTKASQRRQKNNPEWVNARGAIARFERMAIEIRVLDTQECPAMDLGFASLIVAALRRLCAGAALEPDRLNEWRTADLARYFDAAVRDAEATEVHDRRYLAALGCRGSTMSIARAWGEIAERAAADGDLDRRAGQAIEHYLRHGTLATRIAAALPEVPQQADLARVYRELCDCLAEGRPFSGRH